MDIWIITKSLDGTEWGLTTAETLANTPQLQTDVFDEPLIMVKAFKAESHEEAKKEYEKAISTKSSKKTINAS